MAEIAFIPILEAVEIANCPGLTAELLAQLAKRDKVVPFVEHPQHGLVVDRKQIIELAAELQVVRQQYRNQYINGNEAEQSFGVNRVTWYRYRDLGYIRSNNEGLLLLEDVAFVAKLATYARPTSGRPLFPSLYNPHYQSATFND